MLKKIKSLVIAVSALGLLAAPVAMPVAVYAASGTNEIANGVCSGVQTATDTNTTTLDVSGQSNNCSTGTTGTSGIAGLLKLVINVFSAIVGFIAVIMIIYGGVKYITSGGDSNNISGAKNTIVYAIIGLIIVALAQLIVHFVLEKAATVG